MSSPDPDQNENLCSSSQQIQSSWPTYLLHTLLHKIRTSHNSYEKSQNRTNLVRITFMYTT